MADASHISMPNVADETVALGQETLGQASTSESDRQTETVAVSVNFSDKDSEDEACVEGTVARNTLHAGNESDHDEDKISSAGSQYHHSSDHSDCGVMREFPETVSTPKMSPRRGDAGHHQPGSPCADQDGSCSLCLHVYSTEADSDSASSTDGRTKADRLDDFEDSEDTIAALGLEAWREWLHIEHNPEHRDRNPGPPEEPLYPQGLIVRTECYVCFEENDLRRRLCCDFPVCDTCLESYLIVQITRANVNIECININCNSYIHRNEISARLPPKYKMKFYKFLIDANIDPSVKTCPRCSSGLQIDKGMLKKRKVMRNGLLVTCKRCGLEWCFTCHAPWHKNLNCKDFRKGDVLLKDWAREFHYGQLNAQQCPKCKIFIQRSLGCDHMTCSRCDTSFCYRCGENYRGFKLLGNHFSRLSPFGCRYNFMPDAPHMRRLIRGAVLGGRVLGGIALSGLVVAAGAFLLGISVIALPAWGGYKLHKRRRYRQRLRANRKYAKLMALRNLQAKKAAETAVPVLPLPAHDSSDSTADDSSEEMRDGLVVGLQLPDAQRVEVLVHQAISPSSHQDEGGASGDGREVVTDTSIILTDVQEVVSEAGYKTVVANFYARPRGEDCGDAEDSLLCGDPKDGQEDVSRAVNTLSRQGPGCSARERSQSAHSKDNSTHICNEGAGCNPQDGKEDRDCVQSKHSNSSSDAQPSLVWRGSQCHETKEGKDVAEALSHGEEGRRLSLKEQKEKLPENAEKCERKPVESVPCCEKRDQLSDCVEKSDKKSSEKDPLGGRKCSDQKDADQLGKESTNGCFGNIFSKKISVIQLTGKRNSDPQSESQKPVNAFYKSSWDKGQEKRPTMKAKGGRDTSDTAKDRQPSWPADCSVKTGMCEKGVLLQDFVVLSPPCDFSSQDLGEGDSLSMASSTSVDCLDVKDDLTVEQGSSGLSASNSFQGSNLSCDIVTYL